MLRLLSTILTLLVAIAGWLAPSSAEPLNSKQIPADAKWLVHVDCDAARNTQLVKTLSSNWLANQQVRGKLALVKQHLGIDPVNDVLSVTAYDVRFAKHSGVVAARLARLDREKLLAALKHKEPEYQTSHHGDHRLYTWTVRQGRRGQHSITATIYRDAVLLFSRDRQQIQAALDLLDGKAEALDATSPLAAAAPGGSVVIMRGIGMSHQETPFRSGVIGKAESLALAAGEQDGNVFLQGTIVVETSEIASRCEDMVERFRTMAQVRVAPDETLKRLLAALNVAANGRSVKAEWRVASRDLVALAEKVTARRQTAHNKTSSPANTSQSTTISPNNTQNDPQNN